LEIGREALGMDAFTANGCGFSCEPILDGVEPAGACSDCGPGGGVVIDAGQTAALDWDRRVWSPGLVTAACSGLETDFDCAMPIAPPAAVYAATLSYCNDGSGFGFCTSEEALVPFDLDLAADSADVVLSP
jgi:hypothetical protein